MNDLQILKEMEAQGIVLKTDGGQIFYKPKTALSNELRDRLVAHKAAIIQALQREKKSLTVFSKVLKRDIEISWTGCDPKVVYVERTPYTADELAKLRDADPTGVRTAHLLKETFDGKIVDED